MSSWRGKAFGLDLRADFPAPGLAGAHAEPAGPRETTLRLVPRRSRPAVPEAFQTLLRHRVGPRVEMGIARASDGRYRLWHGFHGDFEVSPTGREVACAPARDRPGWVWQRFLAGQVLPLAALLQGLEPLHASAVGLDGRAVLIAGTSGAGKTSVALQLGDRVGGSLLADDVAAIESARPGPLAHPGPALVSVDPRERAALRGVGEGWEVLGTLEGEERLASGPRDASPLPISHLFVVVRRHDAGAVRVESAGDDALAVLLGATFIPWVRDAARLERQLDVSSALAAGARIGIVTAPLDGPSHAVAEAIAAASDTDR